MHYWVSFHLETGHNASLGIPLKFDRLATTKF